MDHLRGGALDLDLITSGGKSRQPVFVGDDPIQSQPAGNCPGQRMKHGTIREAYYKAVEGLSTLAETLEVADVELGSPHDHALIEEHLIACQRSML